MDDFYINNPPFCCGVALLEPFMSSTFNPNSVTRLLTEDEGLLTKSIGRINLEGTCFIIAKPNAEIKIQNHKVIGLALTNYHVAYNLENRSKNGSCYVHFQILLQNNCYKYVNLFELNSILEDTQYSSTSEMPYCLPNDISLMLIINSDNEESVLQEIEMCNEEDLMDISNILVSGFPQINDYRNILPDCNLVHDYEEKITRGFHFFRSQIISEGTMKITDTGLAELKVSATHGMSGSPILVKIGTSFKYVGIYCGGPPIEGQRLLMEILDCINNGDNEGAIMLFGQLPFKNYDIFYPCHEFENLYFIFCKYMTLCGAMDPAVLKSEFYQSYKYMKKNIKTFGKQDIIASLLESLKCLLKNMLFITMKCYQDRSKISFNSGISIKTEAFEVVKRAIEIFKTIGGEFQNETDIENIIRKSLIG